MHVKHGMFRPDAARPDLARPDVARSEAARPGLALPIASRSAFTLLLLGLWSTGLHAQSISPQPEPGLWRSEATTLINGKDLQAALRSAQDDMFKDLPEEQRSMLREALGDPPEIGVGMECISAEDARNLTNPEKLIDSARKDMPECTLQAEEASESSLRVVGNCTGSDGFNGDMHGELTMVSPREMRTRFTGQGVMQLDAEQAPEHLQHVATGEPVNIEHSEKSTWVSADCGALQSSELNY
ncbi:DUF3617 domain-containing protein [Halopseudomonas laoshanensis]|uniref:DUF3617 domain-containing protein n=1 Tax=Halopseudomonas laoshanensis TaxID=2268758 RepID=A0A7V7GWV7_9GAMM|nr:DUF3617 domain-containing protein [Halopseudomonas laoshanensis]KAA0695211.1 DUF3617 domain-containing protein [Halopseudomonas laoshanensis]